MEHPRLQRTRFRPLVRIAPAALYSGLLALSFGLAAFAAIGPEAVSPGEANLFS
ncbi:MAG: hypothetical protein ACE5GX_16510 [Thermoanaerobaculia bacterium]